MNLNPTATVLGEILMIIILVVKIADGQQQFEPHTLKLRGAIVTPELQEIYTSSEFTKAYENAEVT